MRLSSYAWRMSVLAGIVAYAIFFSYFTIERYRGLDASYFDLGIMHQTVYNTYRAIQTGDGDRFLELTDPHPTMVGFPSQIKRPALHNDPLLVVFALLYFIYPHPETLLIAQSIGLALGALAVFLLARLLLAKWREKEMLGAVFALAYLLYPPMHGTNTFDFHAVAFATPLLLFLLYFFLSKRYWPAMICLAFALLTKEHIALYACALGVYFFIKNRKSDRRARNFALAMIGISAAWGALSLFVFMPTVLNGSHFIFKRYQGLNQNTFFGNIFDPTTLSYLASLLGPPIFLPLLSPVSLFALPELAINLISQDRVMRGIYFHYTAVIQPFLFWGAIVGLGTALVFLQKKSPRVPWQKIAALLVCGSALVWACLQSPLPFSRAWNPYLHWHYSDEAPAAASFAAAYADERLSISTTPALAPLFTGRRYFYQFSDAYRLADYVILDTKEIPSTPGLTEAYVHLRADRGFSEINAVGSIAVYKKNEP